MTAERCGRWDNDQQRRCRNKAIYDVPECRDRLCRKHAQLIRHAILWEYRRLMWALEHEELR